MKQKYSLLNMILFVFLILFSATSLSVLAASPNLELTPSIQSVNLGNQATINVVVEDVTDLKGASIILNFDASKLQYISSVAGSFIPDATLMDSNTNGSITLDVAGLGTFSYASGTGTIITVVFERIAAGNTDITFGITELRDKDNIFLTHSTGSGCLIISLPGDFGGPNNGPPDGAIDFEDLMIFAMAYGTTPADANWNPVCDIAGDGGVLEPDGVIDFEDLMIFAMHYGGYALTTSINPSGSGYITLNPSGGTYAVGTQVTITAHPYSGYEFDYWSGDASGISTSVTITIINSNKSITAHFIPIDTIKVGLVFDIGGRGDRSFNDSAYRGIEWATADFNIEHTELEPEEDEDREICLRNLAETGYDLVIGVGFLFTEAITKVAGEFPDTKFAIIDGFIPDIPNVVSLMFKEHEGSFLVGMIAGMRAIEDGKNIVGFIGGMDISLIHKFEAGYRAGVQYVFPECTIFSDYAGDTPAAFADPVKGKELALAQYDYGGVGAGAWVIYHAAGLTGAGVFEAGKERKRYVIGVDSNQNYMGYIEPGKSFGLTSMIKHVDVAVYLTIKSVVEGTFTGGIEVFGLDTDVTIGGTLYYGVDYALDEYNEDSVTSEMIAQVEEAREKIRNGEIIVPIEVL